MQKVTSAIPAPKNLSPAVAAKAAASVAVPIEKSALVSNVAPTKSTPVAKAVPAVAAAVAAAARKSTRQDIARRAFEIYLDAGRPEGQHLEHWARAQAELGVPSDE